MISQDNLITFPSITATQLFVVPKSIPTTAPPGPPLLKRHPAEISTGVCSFSKNLLVTGVFALAIAFELIASTLETAERVVAENILVVSKLNDFYELKVF